MGFDCQVPYKADTRIVAQVGRLWTSLADYYIRQGQYESARDVYEEGLTTVVTVSSLLISK